MNRYFVLLKTEPTHTNDVIQQLKRFPNEPYQGVRLYYTMNCFGTWNIALWFEADQHTHVIDFVNSKLCQIPGILETQLVPTTPIREYVNWK